MTPQTAFTFRFADIEVSEIELRVIRSGEPLAIEPKALRVLICLLRHAGHLVSKEDLLTAVWGDTAVTDNSLSRAVASLRRTLNDDPHNPHFIETVSSSGYRFICPVENGPDAAVTNHPEPHDRTEAVAAKPAVKALVSRRTFRIALATCIVLAITAGLSWYALRPLPTLRISSYTQITSDAHRKGIVGTDGSSLYLTLSSPAGLGVVPVTGGTVTPLSIDLSASKESPNENPLIMDVSPDGTKLLVGSARTGDPLWRSLWVVDAHGGGVRYLEKGFWANWSPDGKTVLYSTPHGDLYTTPSEGGEPRLLLTSPAPPGVPLRAYHLRWSPDGTRIRFVRDDRYWEVSAEGKNPHEILPNWHASNPRYAMCCGEWAANGDFFLFSAGIFRGVSQNVDSRPQIWALDERRRWLHARNPDPAQLTNGPLIWTGAVFSKDGKTIYSRGSTFRGELVRYDPASKGLVPYLGGISAEHVDFSRDGRYLVYVTFPEWKMWRANRDGSGLQQLTGPPFYPITVEWSPDGKQILFYQRSPASHRDEMYTVSSQGGTPKRLLPNDKDFDTSPDWSPDGKKIVFQQSSAGESGYGVGTGEKNRILELDSGRVTDLPPCPKPCFSPHWSPDGRYILESAAISNDDLMVLDLRTNIWTEMNLNRAWISYPRWSHDGRFIYFQDIDWGGSSRSIDPGYYRVPVTGGKAEKIVDLKGFRPTGFYGRWSSPGPDDNPLLLRDAGTYDIYALSLELK